MSLRLVVVFMFLATAVALGSIAWQMVLPARLAAQKAANPPEQVGYLTAAHSLPAGTLARDDDFTTRLVAPDEVPANVLLQTPETLGSLRGALVRRFLDSGAAIRAEDILRPRDRGFLASVLSPGTRAVSIGVDSISGVAGLIWPGDRVDVILTQEMDATVASLSRRVISETILDNVRVIAVDQDIVQGASGTDSGTRKVARTVTLEVDNGQAEKLTVGQQLGKLALTIRAAGDATPQLASGAAAVYGGDVSPALSGFMNAPVLPGPRVRLIEGSKSSEVNFK
jgi:pilus assembly protein CpaB